MSFNKDFQKETYIIHKDLHKSCEIIAENDKKLNENERERSSTIDVIF